MGEQWAHGEFSVRQHLNVFIFISYLLPLLLLCNFSHLHLSFAFLFLA